ncbi:hypothetical protein OHB33_41170 (plasmid) [Streptomyces sp. NBC_01558]|uniref:hypothetical protein n=1 Tax=Streptomyces sp. NBC_01558 TaxID=2975878 RepID=UPI002DDC3366|nr:hypothetical protein [Streptomyces sp. NBC_01558]WSD82798.1 hypothetical protein OHB33_41170 [Streptomyces sp. NBC_01558]
MIDTWRDAEAAPAPDRTARVRRYSPYEVIRVNLFVDGDSYTGIARASYEAAGRLAYSLLLWPRPDRSPSGWYWYDPARMRRRIYPDAGIRP